MRAFTTVEKLSCLQHTLGLDAFGGGRCYRNHYVTSTDCADWELCCALTADGLMQQVTLAQEITGGGTCFMATAAGREFVATHNPKKTEKR